MDFVRAMQEIRLYRVIGGIEQVHVICEKRVAIEIRSERIGSDGPDALIAFLHGYRLGGAFNRDRRFLYIRRSETKCYTMIAVDLGRDHRWRWLRRTLLLRRLRRNL